MPKYYTRFVNNKNSPEWHQKLQVGLQIEGLHAQVVNAWQLAQNINTSIVLEKIPICNVGF